MKADYPILSALMWRGANLNVQDKSVTLDGERREIQHLDFSGVVSIEDAMSALEQALVVQAAEMFMERQKP